MIITNILYTEEQASVTFRVFQGGPHNLLENNIKDTKRSTI